LIYSGQELPNKKRLLFFEKDEINWSDRCSLHDFYKKLLKLRKRNPALTSGDPERKALILTTTSPDQIFSFVRRYEGSEVLVILNLSSDLQSVIITGQNVAGSYTDVLDADGPKYISGQPIQLEGWGYRVFEK
jgi:alpha-amylase